MATKEANKSIFKRPANGGGDENGSPRKGDLIGDLLVIRMRGFEEKFETKYGDQASALFDLLVVDGKHAGLKEADTLVPVTEHPNRQAILAAVPGATHMAGRLPLTHEEAAVAHGAMTAERRTIDTSPMAIAQRLRQAMWAKAVAEGVE